MINIITKTGESYSFDPSTSRIFKDGVLLSSSKVEPVYSSTNSNSPTFSGIYLKERGSILNLNGVENLAITDINLIDY